MCARKLVNQGRGMESDAGGTGRAGTQAALVARARGHEVVVLARSEGVDLVSGTRAAALDRVDAVIDASGVRAGGRSGRLPRGGRSYPRRRETFDGWLARVFPDG